MAKIVQFGLTFNRRIDLELWLREIDAAISDLDRYDHHYEQDWLALVEQRERVLALLCCGEDDHSNG